MSTTGTRVFEARKKLGLTQGQLAGKSGVSQQLIGKIESGSVTKTGSLEEIAKALDVTYAWLKHGSVNTAGATSSLADINSLMLTASKAIDEAVVTMMAINGQKGDNPKALNVEVLKKAFNISFRGKLTGDYVTAAFNVYDINSVK